MILLVDNSPLELELEKQMLLSCKVKVSTATDGDAALEMVANNDYTVIIIDTSVTTASGYEAAMKIREANPFVPIIAISHNDISEDEYKKHGASGALKKPFRLNSLKELLSAYIDLDLSENRLWRRKTDVLFDYDELKYNLNNDEYGIMMIIDRFFSTHADDCENVEKLIAAGEFEEARNILIKLYTMAGNIFCCRLYENAFILYNELEYGQYKRLPIFKDVWTETIGRLSEHGAALADKYKRSQKDDADWKVVWEDFCTLCADFDIQTTDIFKAHQDMFAENLDPEMYKQIEKAATNYDYLTIIEVLEAHHV